jgi:lipid II:glycine glycyltransferase (peptidoglycan interpeptide bridge formation enzyme)
MNFFFTKEQDWLDKWDAFLLETERGLYNQLSDWIKSYEVYGFDFNFLIATEDDKIVGGCGIVIAQFSFFKFFCVPSGPVIDVGYENILDTFISELKQEAQKTACCYFQISLPYCKEKANFNNYNLEKVSKQSNYFEGAEGVAFKYVIPLQGMRLVDLRGENPENVWKNYSSNNKRNLNKTKSVALNFKFVTSDSEIEQAYNCFALNAVEKGYPLRSYASIAKTLRAYVDKNHAKIACCFLNEQIIGALYVMNCGKRLTYINGGVLKEFQHLNISNFMHDKMIQYSIETGLNSYDLSVGGSKGVVKFKESFGSHLYVYVPTRHWILNPLRFKLFLWMEKHLKPHKSKIAGLLIRFRKRKR